MTNKSSTQLWGIFRPQHGHSDISSLEAVVRAADQRSAQAQARRLGFGNLHIKRINSDQANLARWTENPPRARTPSFSSDTPLTPETVAQAISVLKALHRHVDQADIEHARKSGNFDHTARQRQISDSRIVERLNAIDESIAQLRRWTHENSPCHSHGISL